VPGPSPGWLLDCGGNAAPPKADFHWPNGWWLG